MTAPLPFCYDAFFDAFIGEAQPYQAVCPACSGIMLIAPLQINCKAKA
jgi:hypothetical protein